MPLTTRVIANEDEWAALRAAWDDLHAGSPTASTPLAFDWLATWWRVYGPALDSGNLHVITVWRGPELIGAMPLYLHNVGTGPVPLRRLEFLSTGEAEFEETCADYLNVLHRPGEGEACAAAVWKDISRVAWDHLQLLDIPSTSPLLAPSGHPPDSQLFSRGTCPVADLTGGFEAYLQRLSSNRRQQVRRLLRDGERLRVEFELADEAAMPAAFDALIRLHQARWTAKGRQGVFAAPTFVAFHRRLLETWLPSGRAILASLRIEGETVAVLYGFITGTKFDFYQSGCRLDSASNDPKSPGTLAHLLLMRTLAERGVTAYDFLRGPSVYKDRHATDAVELMGIRAWRPTVPAGLYRSSHFAGRILRQGLRQARRLGHVPAQAAN